MSKWKEMAETGKLELPMPEKDRLITLDVKQGKFTFNEVLQLAGDLEQKIKDLIKDGPIRDVPDLEAVEIVMQEMYKGHWND